MAKEFKLLITFDADTRDCKVTGPVNEPELCLMGLELARRVIKQHAARRIVVAPGILQPGAPGPVVQVPNLRDLLKSGGGS